MTGPLGTIYSLQEAADYLRVSKQALARAARRHGIGARFGRDIRFTDADVREMWEAMRARTEGGGLASAVAGYRDDNVFQSLRSRALSERAKKLLAKKGRGGRDG